jgi:hypothetical protein
MGAGLSRLAPDSLRPLNSAAKEWMDEHLSMENPETQFWGDAIVIEPRYVGPIVDGIVGDGLVRPCCTLNYICNFLGMRDVD